MQKRLLSTFEICERYGIGGKLLARWQSDPSIKFPLPLRIGRAGTKRGRMYWKVAEVEKWERSSLHVAQEAQVNDQTFIDEMGLLSFEKSAQKVGVSTRTLERWLRAPQMEFPSPQLYNKRRFFKDASLKQWVSSHMIQSPLIS